MFSAGRQGGRAPPPCGRPGWRGAQDM